MADKVFRKWFARKPSIPSDVKEALDDLVKLTQPSLTTARAVLEEVLKSIFAQPISSDSDRLTPSAFSTYPDTPFLRGATVALDMKSMRGRWLAVCRAVETQNSGASAVGGAFAALQVDGLLTEILAGRSDAVHDKAEKLGLDAALTASVLRYAAFPVLADVARKTASERLKARWDKGCCPTCGSWPLLGEFRGLEQARFLRCGLCASEWEFSRLRCAYCDNRDHRRLGFFHVEGEEGRYKAATCEECHGYVKMISTLNALSPAQLLVADLATLHLDLTAPDRGYMVPG